MFLRFTHCCSSFFVVMKRFAFALLCHHNNITTCHADFSRFSPLVVLLRTAFAAVPVMNNDGDDLWVGLL
jgi:hypothetical protein